MRYYLAPFLIYALEHPESAVPVSDWAVHRLCAKDRIAEFAIFDEAQSKVIARCLQFISLCWDEYSISSEYAVAALRRYWTRFLPDND